LGAKVNAFALVGLGAVVVAFVWPSLPVPWVKFDAEVKNAVRAIHSDTAALRREISAELRSATRVATRMRDRHVPNVGQVQLRVDEAGTIFARNPRYDLVLRFVPQAGGSTVVWRCRASPRRFAVVGCEAASEAKTRYVIDRVKSLCAAV